MEKFIDTNYHQMLYLKKILSMSFFRNPEVQLSFQTLIRANIPVIDIDYSQFDCSYIMKVDKTKIGVFPNYRPEVIFYYGLIGGILRELLVTFKDYALVCIMSYPDALKKFYPDVLQPNIAAHRFLTDILNNETALCNLVSIQCVSDNIVEILT